MIEFRLPSLGADMEQGKLLEWKVAPGQKVVKGDVVAVVDTSKAAVEVEIWEAGTMHELIALPGETYPVGAVLARLLAPGEAPGAAAPPAAASSRQRASPAARKRAAELGLPIDAVAGTGPEGAVTLQDVETAAAKKVTAAPAAEDKQAAMQRAIAAAMSRSKREIPHYYLSEAIALRKAGAWLERENAARPVAERLLMAALFLTAVARACVRHPEMNGHYREGGFVPGVKPGSKTAEYIDDVVSKVTLPGAIFLTLIALLPIWLTGLINVPFQFGGTSLLIVVGVALDTLQQMQQHLLLRKYDGFMKKGRIKFRGRQPTGGF